MTHSRATQISRLRRFQPRATDIRYMGECHICHRLAMFSYIVEGVDRVRTTRDGKQEMTCGWFCGNCGWGNAGSRPLDEDEEQ
jgi:hypothetical protein